MSRRRTGCCPGNVDRSLFPIKATYFFLFAGAAVLHPYIPVYMKELGLTPKETAIILTLGIAGSGVARAVFGALADAYGKHALLMTICCLSAAAAHVCLYFTPKVGDPLPVTRDFEAKLLCGDERWAVCVARYPGAWNGSMGEGNQTGIPQEVKGKSGQRAGVSCSLQCCTGVDPTPWSGYQSMTPEQGMGEVNSLRGNGRSTEATVWRTSGEDPGFLSTSSSTEDPTEQHLGVTSNSSLANLSRSCENFTGLTVGESNWTTATLDVDVKDCGSVWIVDPLANLTGDTRTCDAVQLTYSSCTIRCQGFDPASNAPGKEGKGSGDEGQLGTTFVFCFVFFFAVLFFFCPIFSIADSLVYGYLGAKGKNFGRVRLWGTFALGLFAVLSGLVMDTLTKAGVQDVYMYPFIVCISLTLVAGVLSYRIPAGKKPTLSLSSAPDAPLQGGRHIAPHPSFQGLSKGMSGSVVTLGSQLGQLGATSFPSANGFDVEESTTHESQNPWEIGGSFAVIPEGDLESTASVGGGSRTSVGYVPQKLNGELATPRSRNREVDPGDSLHHLKSQNPEDSLPMKYPKHGDPEESVPLKSPEPFPLRDPVPLKPPDHGAPSSKGSMSHNLALLLASPTIVIIFITVLVAGLILGQHNAFFFWYLNSLGASQALLGLNIVVCCISEIALLFTSGRIIQVVGYRLCLYLVFAVYGVRLLVNSFIRNPWAAIGTEMTQSLCNGLLFPAASLCVNELAPAGMHGTVQGIIAALHWSVGNAIGNAIAGALYDTIGPQRMYQIFAGVSFAYGALLAVTLETLHRRKPKIINNNKPNLKLNGASSAPVELPKSTGSDEPDVNHLHDR